MGGTVFFSCAKLRKDLTDVVAADQSLLPPSLCMTRSYSGDTVVLVRDPLACLGRRQGSRGGITEGEGIKMACPPREVRRPCIILTHLDRSEAHVGMF